MKKHNLIAIILMIFFCTEGVAQQDALTSQYMFNRLLINPAYTGSHKFYNGTLLYRKQWIDIDGAPTTAVFSVDGPVKGTNSALGLLGAFDKIGVSKQTDLYAYYAYHLQVSKHTKLALGLRGGVSYHEAALTELEVWDPEDPVFTKDIEGEWLPNFGAGLYLYRAKFYAGLSAPRLLSYDSKTFLSINNETKVNQIRHYFLNAGYVIEQSPEVVFKPSFLLKYVNNAPIQADLNLNVLFYKRLWVGASYRTNDAVVGILEIQATKNLRIGYAYDYSINDLSDYNQGSHEFMLAIDFGKEVTKMKSPRYF